MDLREVMREQGLDHYEMFNRTDHHWTSEASFWCFQQLYPAICDTLGETVNQALLAEESYQWTTYEDIFLGSEGRRAGIPYGGMDDFTVITPLFETSIRVSRPYESRKSRREAEGTFEETLLHTEILEREDVYNRACDDVYGSNYALQVTENLDETVSDKNHSGAEGFVRKAGSGFPGQRVPGSARGGSAEADGCGNPGICTGN